MSFNILLCINKDVIWWALEWVFPKVAAWEEISLTNIWCTHSHFVLKQTWKVTETAQFKKEKHGYP